MTLMLVCNGVSPCWHQAHAEADLALTNHLAKHVASETYIRTSLSFFKRRQAS